MTLGRLIRRGPEVRDAYMSELREWEVPEAVITLTTVQTPLDKWITKALLRPSALSS